MIIRNLNIPGLIMTLRLIGAISDILRICDLKCSLIFNSSYLNTVKLSTSILAFKAVRPGYAVTLSFCL